MSLTCDRCSKRIVVADGYAKLGIIPYEPSQEEYDEAALARRPMPLYQPPTDLDLCVDCTELMLDYLKLPPTVHVFKRRPEPEPPASPLTPEDLLELGIKPA